ncbi:hypothetical protein [Fischerella sp. NIES-3754]|jgi:hypothetical protein|uniref:hypothetical protein n=1 Tax=Fischerella sp. NIES-3754 TaxID=1752063 RepID=UPI000721011B|nr:hypothetical protein [Fischerella sp. NIES-3754]PMB53753.1 hypothetical protein CEN39_02715 [Fischerella thermalis CCMEE 5201]BAU08040.1 hypothetical protein FIS3754_39810 [Fischerella sp. NIES-3754]BCX10398.1 MAG: hypothetical protein KatS3mg066_4257 [Fischerella sp.]
MADKKELRGYVPNEINRLFRAVVVLKDSNLSDALTEAVEDWLKKPENQALITKHNLKDSID